MNLIVNWTSPTPYPANDFDISYRRNYDPGYTVIAVAGTTSGSTHSFPVTAPTCYEGYIQSECGGENISPPVPFGVNAYQSFHVTFNVSGTTLIEQASTIYPNTYPILAEFTIHYHIGPTPGTLTISGTYPANTTSFSSSSTVPAGLVIDSFNINSIISVFDNGGELQQLDSVNTPPYIKTYWDGNTSGTSWNGSPLTLPSFIIQGFTPTAVDGSGNVLAGNILISWIADSIYGNAISPYNEVIFNVYDPNAGEFMGTAIANPNTLGLITASIPINIAVSPINTSTEFTMTTSWGDNSLSHTSLFYLPNF